MICIDKAQSYRRFIREINYRYDPHFDCIRHVDKKWLNNRIESDHAAMKRFLGYRQSFRSLRKVKVVLICIEICPVAAFLPAESAHSTKSTSPSLGSFDTIAAQTANSWRRRPYRSLHGFRTNTTQDKTVIRKTVPSAAIGPFTIL